MASVIQKPLLFLPFHLSQSLVMPCRLPMRVRLSGIQLIVLLRVTHARSQAVVCPRVFLDDDHIAGENAIVAHGGPLDP